MKGILIIAFTSIALFCMGQNNTPQVEITGTIVDETAEIVTLNYTLTDTDGDACEVWLKISSDNGVFYEMVPTTNLSGNVGTGISPSQSLSLTWDYSDLSVSIGSVAVQLFASDHQTIDIAEIVNQVDEAQLLSTLETIVGERHYQSAPAHLDFVRTYIEEAFTNANLQTENHDFVYSNTTMTNILGRKSGAKNEAKTFIIDGHFDAVKGSPGADDNGTAVAGVLEALRILSQYSFEHSIRFIGFDAEELGLIGSQRYVQNSIQPFENIEGVLNFEMIGYYSSEPNTQTLPAGFEFIFPEAAQAVADDEYRGNFLFSCANTTSSPLSKAYIAATEKYVPDLRLISVELPGNGDIAPDLRRSDHASFWDANMQALMLTDAANFRNPNYHTANDSIGTLNFAFMKNVVKATLATVAELAIPISAAYDEVDLSTQVSVHNHGGVFPAAVSLFPNPSNGLLSIKIENAKESFHSRIEVYELTGQRVHRDVLRFEEGTSISTVDLQQLPTGSYLLLLHADDATETIGFVITH